MKNFCFFFLLCITSSYGQTQIGTDINGEAAGDSSGYSVSLSADGSTVAIGAIGNNGNGVDSGHVRVFQNISGVWTQIGSDIDGDFLFFQSGYSVSLSADGSIVAIGTPLERQSSSNPYRGYVRVYQNIAGVWTQIGSDILGDSAGDQSGYSVSLSADGTIVAVGANNKYGLGAGSGQVKVFKNISGLWTLIGDEIQGEAAFDQCGHSVSLSADGSVVAVGAITNDGNGFFSGQVRAFQNSNNAYQILGSDIDGEAAFDQSGYSVSLSADGNTLAIGAITNAGNEFSSGHVRVYQNVSGVWTQIGSDIDGEATNDQSGYSISLSADGTIVAIGAPFNDGNGVNSGHVRIYRNVAGVWTPVGFDINGEADGDKSGFSVSLSADGNTLAIGAPQNNGNGSGSGHVRVYDLSSVLKVSSFVHSNFVLFPNPSKGIVNISLKNNLELKKVIVYNHLGQIVKTTTTTVFSTSELVKGNYFVEVITNEGKATKSLIVN